MRVEVDGAKDRMRAKIRQAQLQKVPYMLIVGGKEQQAGAIAVRTRTGADLSALSLDDVIARASASAEARVGTRK